MRMTRQRTVILEAVHSACGHPTADEVYDQVRRSMPGVSLATVYRNLELLASRGMIRSVQVGGSQMRFDRRTGEHYHVRCECCGAISDVTLPPQDQLDRQVRCSDSFDITGHRLEFTGICSRCRRLAEESDCGGEDQNVSRDDSARRVAGPQQEEGAS